MEVFDLKELAKKSGKSEVELAKSIAKVLMFKANYYQQDQTVILRLKPSKE